MCCVQGPPGPQGHTGPRGFKGRRVSPRGSGPHYISQTSFRGLVFKAAHHGDWDYLIFHHQPCRGFQDLQDWMESLACQEIQDCQDPPAIRPTLGSVILPDRNQSLFRWAGPHVSLRWFQVNLMSHMASGFNEKSGPVGMVSGSGVSKTKTQQNFTFK